MYDIREELMRKMVTELNRIPTRFEIMSDYEFYNSEYGEKRRRNNQTCSTVVYMHCLIPGTGKNLLGVYFHKKDIAIAAPIVYQMFSTDIVVDREEKNVYTKPYFEYRVRRTDYDVMYEDTRNLIIEMLNFGEEHDLDKQ